MRTRAAAAAGLVTFGLLAPASALPGPQGEHAPGVPVVLNDDGGWCWFQDERALVVGGALEDLTGERVGGGVRNCVQPAADSPSRMCRRPGRA